MLKTVYLFIFTVFIAVTAQAQSADSVYNKYLDFNLARFEGDHDKVYELGEDLLPYADKLPEKTRISFYFSIGKMYEDDNQPQKAIGYYEKVATAVPSYYVVHRALGYLYLADVRAIETKLNATTDYKTNQELTLVYSKAVKKALPHLEKAQACDPSDETLAIIKMLYQNIKDTNALNSLDDRLKDLGKNCMDILEDK